MKWALLLLIIGLVVIAGCTQAPEANTPTIDAPNQASSNSPIIDSNLDVINASDDVEIGEVI